MFQNLYIDFRRRIVIDDFMVNDNNNSSNIRIVAVAIIIAGLAIAYALSLPQNHGSSGGSQGLITVTATGSVSAYPTQAVFYLNTNGSGPTSAAATLNLSATMNRLNGTVLPFLNGNTSLITTQYYNVYRPYNSTFFVASESLMITLQNSSKAAPMLLAISSVPNVYVSNVQPQLSSAQISALRNQAIAAAMANATAQAMALNVNGGQISVVNVSINNYYVYPFPYPVFATGSGSANLNQSLNSLFYSGTSKVTESVTATFRTG